MKQSISVIIPLYNHAAYIDEAIYSVLLQSRPASEIIVVDDGSNDTSLEKAMSIARRHPQMVVWSHQNRGAHATLNAGIHRATGDLVAILNSDDAFEPERLERCAELFERGSMDAVFTGLVTVDAQGAPRPNDWLDRATEFYRNDRNLGRALINGNILVTTSNIVARRYLFEEVGYFSALRYAHDLDFFLRLVATQRLLHIIDQPLLRYRLHDSNTINEAHSRVKLEWATATAFFLYLKCRNDGWSRLFDYEDLLEKHDLLKLIAPMLGYFGNQPASTLEKHPILTDEVFNNRARGMIL